MSIVLGALLPVGSVIHSMLTEAQFQAQAGSGWVLADGRSAAGSVYNTITGAGTIPNMQGVFLRGKGATYNPDGSLALGAITSDKTRSHNHNSGTQAASAATAPANKFMMGTTLLGTATVETTYWGGNETAPISITVNIFMRIN